MIGEIGNFKMKKLLLILLCLPMIGLSQTKEHRDVNEQGITYIDNGRYSVSIVSGVGSMGTSWVPKKRKKIIKQIENFCKKAGSAKYKIEDEKVRPTHSGSGNYGRFPNTFGRLDITFVLLDKDVIRLYDSSINPDDIQHNQILAESEESLMNYFDTSKLNDIEGIYKRSNNNNTIAIKRFDGLFKALVLKSDNPHWKIGEVQMILEPTGSAKVYSCKYYSADKESSDLIISNNTPGLLEIKITNELDIQYIRMYPFDQPTDNKTANSMSSVVKNEKQSTYEILKELADLKNEGILTEAEFNIEKAKVLNKSDNSNAKVEVEITKKKSSFVDINIPSNKKVKDRYALVIGNEDYSSSQRTLSSEQNVDFAVNDATIFKQYCLKTLGVKENNMFFITNATAGKMNQEINRVIEIISALGNNAELIFYYAGHGYPDELTKAPYLIPVDISGSDLSYAIKLNDLYQKLANTNAKQVTMFLDACFTGGGRESGLVASRGVKVKPKEGSLSGNLVVFSASSGEQSALSYSSQNHGVFTYHLLKNLKDSNGSIKYGELFDNLEQSVNITSLKENSKKQTPKVNTSSKVINDWRNWKF